MDEEERAAALIEEQRRRRRERIAKLAEEQPAEAGAAEADAAEADAAPGEEAAPPPDEAAPPPEAAAPAEAAPPEESAAADEGAQRQRERRGTTPTHHHHQLAGCREAVALAKLLLLLPKHQCHRLQLRPRNAVRRRRLLRSSLQLRLELRNAARVGGSGGVAAADRPSAVSAASRRLVIVPASAGTRDRPPIER